jgi:hypothetical protein
MSRSYDNGAAPNAVSPTKIKGMKALSNRIMNVARLILELAPSET